MSPKYIPVRGYKSTDGTSVDGVYYLAVGDRVRVPSFGYLVPDKQTIGTIKRVEVSARTSSVARIWVAFEACKYCEAKRIDISGVDGSHAIPLRVRRKVPR